MNKNLERAGLAVAAVLWAVSQARAASDVIARQEGDWPATGIVGEPRTYAMRYYYVGTPPPDPTGHGAQLISEWKKGRKGHWQSGYYNNGPYKPFPGQMVKWDFAPPSCGRFFIRWHAFTADEDDNPANNTTPDPRGYRVIVPCADGSDIVDDME